MYKTKEKRIKFYKLGTSRNLLPVFCLAAFLCVGCGGTKGGTVSTNLSDGSKVLSMESTAIVDYEVPKLYPNIMVDAAGYRAEGTKLAVVKGKKLPESFVLVDSLSGETVYTGQLQDVRYNEEQGLYSAYADFGDWKQDGSFYLKCDYLGHSYDFNVETGLYERRFSEICQKVMAGCREQTVTYDDVKRVLMAYEWYGEIFADEDANAIPDVLEAVADWIALTESRNLQKEQVAEPGQEAAYAAVLAKFSYLYQKYDKQYATDCLKRASIVFEKTQSTIQKDAESFHALTELYRATGIYSYGKQIAEYKSFFEGHSNITEEVGYLHGVMTYMATRQRVDMDICVSFMENLMARGEKISDVYEEMIHPVNARNNGAEDLLFHVELLACANYVMNNYQYNHVMEEFLHYLRGRNSESVDFYTEDIGEQTKYLIVLSQLVAMKDNLGE